MRCRHCFVWGGGSGELSIGCPHCGWIRNRIDVSRTTAPELLSQQIAESRANHRQHCRKP